MINSPELLLYIKTYALYNIPPPEENLKLNLPQSRILQREKFISSAVSASAAAQLQFFRKVTEKIVDLSGITGEPAKKRFFFENQFEI